MDGFEINIDRDADQFYDNIRTFIVVFLTVATLLPTSYILLRSRCRSKDAYLSKDDVTVQRIVLLVCMIIVSLCIIMVFMLPLSILANEVLILFPDHYYIQWINVGLLHAFFVLVRTAFKVTCFSIPFSFFLLHSHSVYKGNKGVSCRCFHSVLYVTVVNVALFGSLTVFASTIFDVLNCFNLTNSSLPDLLPQAFCFSPRFCYSSPIHFFGDLICCVDSALLITQQSVSYTGLALLLVCIPSGICGIISKMIRISSSKQSQRPSSSGFLFTQMVDEEYRIQLEKCLRHIKLLNKPFLYPENQLSSHLTSQTESGFQLSPDESSESLDLGVASCRTPGSFISAIAFILLLVLFVASAAYAFLNVIVMLYSLFISRGEETTNHSFAGEYILLGQESVSKFGFIGACLQVSYVSA